jgi:low affinity Fe/Cu permease
MDRLFTRFANSISGMAGQPWTFALAFLSIVVWGATGPLFHYSDTWQLVVNTSTTIVTFLMVFLIQNSQNRDAAAMQAKLDEIIRSIGDARNQFIGLEHMTERDVEKVRGDLEQECDDNQESADAAATITRLLKRS